MSTTEFLHYRIEAMQKRIAELEAENDVLKKAINLPLPPSVIMDQIEYFKKISSAPNPFYMQMAGKGNRNTNL